MRVYAAASAWLLRCTPRERLLLATLGMVLAGWAVWAGAVQPLLARSAALDARLHRMSLALPRIAALPPPAAQAASADTRPLPALVADTAAQAGLDIRRLQDRDGAVTVQVDVAAFDAVMLWIETLERGEGLVLTDLTLSRDAAPGMVLATLTVAR